MNILCTQDCQQPWRNKYRDFWRDKLDFILKLFHWVRSTHASWKHAQDYTEAMVFPRYTKNLIMIFSVFQIVPTRGVPLNGPKIPFY